MMSFEEDDLDYAGAFNTSPNHSVSSGIEVEEALRVGGSEFLAQSNPNESDLTSFFK